MLWRKDVQDNEFVNVPVHSNKYDRTELHSRVTPLVRTSICECDQGYNEPARAIGVDSLVPTCEI